MGINVSNYVKNTVPIGTVFYHISSVPPEGAFLLNGQIIYNCSTLYPEFYQYVTNNNGIRKITSSVYESELSSIGICGGFVVDSGNGSIRLPNISNGFIEGSNGNNIGNVLDAGLPNITGRVDNIMTSYNSAIEDNGLGSLSLTAYSATGPTQDSNKQICRLFINASKSSSVYGNSNTVQPKSVCYSVCIQVFNAATSLSNQISAQLASEMQNKADIGLNNINTNGKNVITDTAFEIDSSSFTSNFSKNVLYNADKTCIICAYFVNTTGSDKVAYIKIADPNNDDSSSAYNAFQIGGTIFNGESKNVIAIVPKGWIFAFSTSPDITISRINLLKFKNSLSNNN